ncbi:MAG: SsrA-binding protein [Phycisphaerae bacterium]|nr:MAG: SsrA-binding protein [Phycisphaerae bacterium]
MSKSKGQQNSPRIVNRRAMHDYFIEGKLECGIVLVGSEVKALRQGDAQLQDAYAHIKSGELYLSGAHIDPYTKASIVYNHEPRRERKLLAHRREIHKLEQELSIRGTTLIPLAIYFKNGRAKVELGLARGKQKHDKRETIKRKEMDREMRRAMTTRGR